MTQPPCVDGNMPFGEPLVSRNPYTPPQCCGEIARWSSSEGFWICRLQDHHAMNDFGETVNTLGRTEYEQAIMDAREEYQL